MSLFSSAKLTSKRWTGSASIKILALSLVNSDTPVFLTNHGSRSCIDHHTTTWIDKTKLWPIIFMQSKKFLRLALQLALPRGRRAYSWSFIGLKSKAFMYDVCYFALPITADTSSSGMLSLPYCQFPSITTHSAGSEPQVCHSSTRFPNMVWLAWYAASPTIIWGVPLAIRSVFRDRVSS